MKRKRVAILGSTGSIGKQTLAVIEEFSNDLEVVALTAHSSVELIAQQITQFTPKLAAINGQIHCNSLQSQFPNVQLYYGDHYLKELLLAAAPDIVVNAVSGISGLRATFTVLDLGIDLALANKESIVSAGNLLIDLAKQRQCHIYPVDSEHSAVWQCLQGERKDSIRKVILTASGGPFFGYQLEELARITPKQALNHPTWSMGNKISIDSATLMNKGLEVIEAALLFDIPYDQIDVVVHPQSIIHSFVEYHDGAIMGQLGVTDMRQPIQYALFGGKRYATERAGLDLTTIQQLNFYEPDTKSFPCLELAYTAGRIGQSLPIVMNTANQFAVEGFLEGKFTFLEIPSIIAQAMEQHALVICQDIEEVIEVQNQTITYLRERYTTS